MMHALYNLVVVLVTPFLMIYLRFHSQYRPLLQRFSPKVPSLDVPPIWVQAASVGEVITAQCIVEGLKTAYPGVPIVLSIGTATGMEEAQQRATATEVLWFPFDQPWVVRRFFKRLKPRALVLIETEIWPNVLHRAHQENVPVIIVNGRLSEKNFTIYERYANFFRPYVSPIRLAAMQTPLDAQRIQVLGLSEEATVITGNLKFDGAVLDPDTPQIEAFHAAFGLHVDTPIVVFGSTRPGEEKAFAGHWKQLKERFPELCLIVAPRHLKRVDEVVEVFSDEVIHRRSECTAKPLQISPGEIMLLDTLGELKAVYALATVAIVGGSFSESVQGHNPIEPAALGIPTLVGPHMKNFLQPTEILRASGGLIQVEDMGSLTVSLETILGDAAMHQRMGESARLAVIDNQGALAKTIDHMRDILH